MTSQDYDGPITHGYIEYCRSDVRATWRIFTELRSLYLKHGRTREIDRIYSEPDSGAKRNAVKRSGFERLFQARQVRLGMAS